MTQIIRFTHREWRMFLVVIIIICFANNAFAAEYFVSTGGNDGNPGTAAAPFRTIQKGADVAKAGDIVTVLTGTYIETAKSGNFAGVENRNNGTASARIVFRSQQKWGAKVSSRRASILWASLGNYVDIQGFEIDGTGSNAGPGIGVYGNSNRILYNHVHHIQKPGCLGSIGIDTQNYDTNLATDIIGNLVHDIRPVVSDTCNLSGYGIYLGTRGGRIENNIVYNNYLYGIHLWHAPLNSVVSHNLIFNTEGKSAIIFGCGDAPNVQCHDIMISNNIIINNQSLLAVREYGNNDGSNKVMNNIIFGNANNTIQMINGTASGNLGVDPKLVNLAGGDYHLTAGSPAIDAGTTVCVPGQSSCVPAIDFALGRRPAGSGYDIGPYEYGAAPGSIDDLPPPGSGGGDGGDTTSFPCI